jgi:dienelactone hydrolase
LSIHSGEFQLELLGRAFWPEREDLSTEFMRLLGAAQAGGSTIAECRIAANRIDPADDHSWYREWTSVADTNSKRGNAALREGYVLTARSNWLRAINYYQSARFRSTATTTITASRSTACANARATTSSTAVPQGEVLSIPWPGGYTLEAYLLPAAEAARPSPAIICIGEPGQRKEEYLHKVARHARERGMSLLAVDLLGAGTDSQSDPFVGRSQLEMTLGVIMDHLSNGETSTAAGLRSWPMDGGLPSWRVGIAFDDRFAAAVCDGGIWDMHERGFLAARANYEAETPRSELDLSRVARNIQCPVLITTGSFGWLKAERVRELYRQLEASGRDVTLKIFAVFRNRRDAGPYRQSDACQ